MNVTKTVEPMGCLSVVDGGWVVGCWGWVVGSRVVGCWLGVVGGWGWVVHWSRLRVVGSWNKNMG